MSQPTTLLSLELFSLPMSCSHCFGVEPLRILLAGFKPGDSRHFLSISSFIKNEVLFLISPGGTPTEH